MANSKPEEHRENPPIQRVVELDDKRVNHIQGLVEDLKTSFYTLRSDAEKRQQALERLERTTEKLDEAIRGNGKEGLNTTVGRLEDQLDAMPRMIEDAVRAAMTQMSINLNTAKIRAITQEEIKKALDAPGGWSEFRRSWLFPVVLGIITTVVGFVVGRVLLP